VTLQTRFFSVSPPRVRKKTHYGQETAYEKIHVSNPKEQDPFKTPKFFIFHTYGKTNGMNINSKYKKSKI
jgi:hypothetical protein